MVETEQKSSDKIHADLIKLVLLVLAVLVVYGRVGHYDMLNLDDNRYVLENIHIQSGFNYANVKWAFTAFYEGTWQPMVWLSYMLDYTLYGLNPGGYHLTNLILHILNVLILYFIFIKVMDSTNPGLMIAALFALHPIHIESVAWIAERKDVLSTFFGLLTLLFYSQYSIKQDKRKYVAAILTYLMGLMSKPMLVTLPVIMLIMDYWPLQRIQANDPEIYKSILKRVAEKIPFLFLALGSSFITIKVQEQVGAIISLDTLPLSNRLVVAIVGYIKYILKLFWPFDLIAFYPHPVELPLLKGVGALLLIISLTMLAFMMRKKQPWLIAGWLWYLVALFPVSGVVQIGSFEMADRFAYVPFIGLYVIIACSLVKLCNAGKRFYYAVNAIFAVYCALLASITYIQVGYWKNTKTLFTHAVKVMPYNNMAHTVLGDYYRINHNFLQSLAHYKAALNIRPQDYKVCYNLGELYYLNGRYPEALKQFNKSAQLSKDTIRVDSLIKIAGIYADQKQFEQSINTYLKAIELSPRNITALINIAFDYQAMGAYPKALAYYNQAIAVNPDNPITYNNMGLMFIGQGKIKTAISYFESAVKIAPDDQRSVQYLKLATSLYMDLNSIVQKFEASLDFKSNDNRKKDKTQLVQTLNDLTQTKKELEKFYRRFNLMASRSKALNVDKKMRIELMESGKQKYFATLTDFEQIVKSYPDLALGHYHLACVLAHLNRVEDAIDELEAALQKENELCELILIDQDFDPIRNTDRFKTALSKGCLKSQ